MIIKLGATPSTNLYLRQLMNERPLDDFTIVVAREQTLGRGQMGTTWEAEAGKNLTFSVLKRLDMLEMTNPFVLNMCVSLAVFNTLTNLNIPDLRVKWPNDILSGHSKICGILIENILSGNRLVSSVIGIGLNVNQKTFKNLPNVSSLSILSGKMFDLDELVVLFRDALKTAFSDLEQKGTAYVKQSYERVLFRKDKPSTFKDAEGTVFMGFIRGVSKQGKLMVALEDEVLKEYNMKEISLMY
ncbi:biotin--[acetyl-CoA-carboxylase] ligase [Maribacter polysaccharolyticus]|uniref:biotin--[acetyl-CoA-carboxylase] ligase n=1 Tax=Maribacter polysaccharolyticus TaxID=3020831 RepID=UPI00237EFD85|nr:biotin--[acetyl-CoA-carboxylase] ligase [Maribacter polysaccharolyticus]MDE3743933.1 biotin--[acetyl-CoA-carboxylase] ligase [Maribacter polysaccharolyticus]